MRSSARIKPVRDDRARCRHERRGAIIILTAILLVILMALLALSIDTGYMYTVQTELDRSVDAAALAGAAALIQGDEQVNDTVVEYLVRNPVGGDEGAITDAHLQVFTTQFLAERDEDYEIQLGEWNADKGQLESVPKYPSAVGVSMTYPNLPLFFGRVLGKDHFSIGARAIAMYQPRDITLVLDYSGSMNDDSELKAIPTLGYQPVMENLEQIYGELGYPEYGSLEFEPQYVVVERPGGAGENQPDLSVEYRYRSVHVASSLALNSVKLKYTNGATQTFSGLSGTEGTFAGTGSQANQVVSYVWVNSGDASEYFDLDSGSFTGVAINALGLNQVSYPYDSGSWSDYVSYGKSNSSNRSAGFEYKFGMANLISYWLEKRPSYHQTRDLWKVSAQPVTAVKDSVSVFMDFIRQVDTNDRVALVVYNGPNGEATLETPLTNDLALVDTLTSQRQAGHYHVYTNIGAGMRVAREELEHNGRPNAFKLIVLMTDGRANWNDGRYDMTAARNHVLAEADADKGLNFPVVTISLGAGADIDLMNQVAEITESRTFNVPGGQSVSAYRDGLYQVFKEIADDRPLKLVQ